MAQGIWKGDINFGLVYIPVTLYAAQSPKANVKLVLLDKRDLSRVGYDRVNKTTGKKVPLDQLVEGYENKDENYAVLTREELKNIHPTATQSIDILEFVDLDAIHPEYFETPYYLEPIKKGQRAYALLREALRASQKVGIAKVVIRTREYLAALMVEDKAIMLQLLRFPEELVPQDKFDLPELKLEKLGIKKQELSIAEELIKRMSAKWDPKKYHDDYEKDLMAYIREKIKLGKAPKGRRVSAKSTQSAQVVDIMDLLKKSVEKKKKKAR